MFPEWLARGAAPDRAGPRPVRESTHAMILRRGGPGTTRLVALVLIVGLTLTAAGSNALLGYAERHYHVANTAADLRRDLTGLDSFTGDLAVAPRPSDEVI